MPTKPVFSLPLLGSSERRVATKSGLDAEVNRVLSRIWDAAVLAQMGPPEQEALLDELQERLDELNAAISAPFVIFGFGQSNMRGFQTSVTGSHDTGDGVYFWNAPNGVPVSPGTQWLPAAFGTPPLDNWNATAGAYANNLLLHAAKEIRARTGRPVYVIMISRGSQQLEAFMSDATLAANGWPRGSNQDLYTQAVLALSTALPLVPGSPTMVDAVMVHQGEASAADGPELYARKMKAVLLGLETAGYINRESTPVVLGEIAAGATATNWTRHRNAIRRFKEAWGFDRWKQCKIATSQGLDVVTSGDVHFTGASLVSLGQRYADAVFATQPDEILTVNATDYSVDGSLRWATSLVYSGVADYDARKTVGLESPVVSEVNNGTLGWAYRVEANTAFLMGHRHLVRLPVDGVVRVDYEVMALDATGVLHRAFCWCYDNGRVFTTSSIAAPGSSPATPGAGRLRVSRTFKRNGSSATADVTLPADTEYIAPGVWIGAASSSGAGVFNILDIRVG
ncbi:sialate O-acetylesterase [Paracoccus sp. DMF-8]|uniref:sialate O-acetylesterase n=1 Tax=Paracoccus sp. DMF-8 TaxID=3019445 RepID=UPI0023E857FB|nr:sialate O-acetylesterase [Paracoccus sp. DMF-8]MDF3606347.1 sialate O-acetylesterase [Paracoccus sp. DMF-8]